MQSLAEATLEVEQATERHYHRATEEIYFVLKGQGADGGRRRDAHVRPGDAVLIPAGAWHQLENNGTSELRILCCCAPAVLARRHVLRVAPPCTRRPAPQ